MSAYNTFPSHGTYVTPQYVYKITDNDGRVIEEFTNQKRDAISEQTAYLMVNMMRGVVNEGTGNRLRSVYGLRGEIAGKTGTTNDNSDGWFIGYTPNITAGAWVGGEDRNVHFSSTALGQGANAALPIWGIWMKKCLADPTIGWSMDNDHFLAPTGGALELRHRRHLPRRLRRRLRRPGRQRGAGQGRRILFQLRYEQVQDHRRGVRQRFV